MLDPMIDGLVLSYTEKFMDELSPRSWAATDDADLRRNTERLVYQLLIDIKLKETNMLMTIRKNYVDFRGAG